MRKLREFLAFLPSPCNKFLLQTLQLTYVHLIHQKSQTVTTKRTISLKVPYSYCLIFQGMKVNGKLFLYFYFNSTVSLRLFHTMHVLSVDDYTNSSSESQLLFLIHLTLFTLSLWPTTVNCTFVGDCKVNGGAIRFKDEVCQKYTDDFFVVDNVTVSKKLSPSSCFCTDLRLVKSHESHINTLSPLEIFISSVKKECYSRINIVEQTVGCVTAIALLVPYIIKLFRPQSVLLGVRLQPQEMYEVSTAMFLPFLSAIYSWTQRNNTLTDLKTITNISDSCIHRPTIIRNCCWWLVQSPK